MAAYEGHLLAHAKGALWLWFACPSGDKKKDSVQMWQQAGHTWVMMFSIGDRAVQGISLQYSAVQFCALQCPHPPVIGEGKSDVVPHGVCHKVDSVLLESCTKHNFHAQALKSVKAPYPLLSEWGWRGQCFSGQTSWCQSPDPHRHSWGGGLNIRDIWSHAYFEM